MLDTEYNNYKEVQENKHLYTYEFSNNIFFLEAQMEMKLYTKCRTLPRSHFVYGISGICHPYSVTHHIRDKYVTYNGTSSEKFNIQETIIYTPKIRITIDKIKYILRLMQFGFPSLLENKIDSSKAQNQLP